MSGCVARMGKMKNAYTISVGKLKVRDHSEDLGVYWRITLEWIRVECGLDAYGSG